MTSSTPSNFKKWAAAALLTGGVGIAGMALAGPASAQDDATTTTSTESAQTDQTQPQGDQGDAPAASGDDAERSGRRGNRGPRGAGMETVAETLGLSVEDLRAELGEDTSLADVAEAQSVDVQTLIDAMVDDAETHLAGKVSEGDLTQEEADGKSADITERVTERVNTAGRPEGGKGRGGPGCDKDGDAPADGEAPADTGDAPADAPATEGFGTLVN